MGVGQQVLKVGTLDLAIYCCISDKIITDEVVITQERIEHIMERHPGDYEQYINDISDALRNPDYILEANKVNTGVVLKELDKNGEKIKLILRIKVESDPTEYKNSVLSFWHIGDNTWNKNLRNKKILYKRVGKCYPLIKDENEC